MIQGQKRTEKEYRNLQMDSSSSLKEFSIDRKKYFRRYILGEAIQDEESKASKIGSLVDCLLLSPSEFDNKFCLSCLEKEPTGLMMEFCNALIKHTFENTKEGKLNISFEEIAKLAYVDSGFKISFEKVLEKFIGQNPEIWYKEALDIKSKGLIVITLQDLQNAEKIIEELKTNEFIAPIINLKDKEKGFEVYNQLPIDGYEVFGHKFKSLLDKVVVDHINKLIFVYDLKIVWNVEGFYEDYFLYRRSYIQAYLYEKAIKFWREQNNLKDYRVVLPKFIVGDSISYFKSLIYEMTNQEMEKAEKGFEYKGKKYKGVRELILELQWHQNNNIWEISMENYLNGGIVKIGGNE